MTGSDSPKPRFSRRGLLLGGGAVIAGGAGVWATAPAFADAALPGGRFDLTVGSIRDIREKRTSDVTVLQSFDFDHVHRHIYVIQVKSGGSAEGHMRLTKLNYDATIVSYMNLYGFGHGVNIGVEPSGSSAYIWTETDSNPDSGYGRAVTRFKYVGGSSLTYGNSNVPVFRPMAGSTSNTPGVDMLNRRIAVRYRQSGSVHYKVYGLNAFKAGDFTPVSSFAQVGIKEGEVFQGWALWGDYVYQMTGTAYTGESGSNPPSKHGNCHVSCIDVRTGALVQRSWTQAAYSLDYREPEGMGVMPASPPRLYMGFASGAAGARKISLYYKPRS